MNIYAVINEYLQTGRRGMLATVIKREGPAPRDVGTKMFVGEEGTIFGTVGGGYGEAEVYNEALFLMNNDQTKVLRLLTETQKAEAGDAGCGGNLHVLLEPVTARYIDLYREIESAEKDRKKGIVITGFHDGVLSKTFVDKNMNCVGDALADEAILLRDSLFHEKKAVLIGEVLVDPLRITFPLYLFGAGHVSGYVSMIARIAEFDVTVIDDREEFANRERFPDADLIIGGNIHDTFECLEFTGNEYVVIVTRSHETDAAVLYEALQKPARYIGMIGSTRKVKAILGQMRGKGLNEENLKRVHAPIGIPIEAETPQEIAVSIVAELIAARNSPHPVFVR